MTTDLHELAASYALDALDSEETLLFEQHLRTCTTCPGEVEEFRNVATALAETTAQAPPPDLKNRVLAQANETPQLTPNTHNATARSNTLSNPPVRNRRSVQPVLLMAAALLLVGGITALLTWPSSGDTSVNELASSVDALRTVLEPAIDGQAGELEVIWSNDRNQVAIVGSDLSSLGPDQAYALWFLLDDGVAPAGLFQPENGTVSTVIDVADHDTNGWGITIEPVTGSEQPTTEVIFAGSL